jgi:ferric-dicitrate binding protein FerR (iron transport regulator)
MTIKKYFLIAALLALAAFPFTGRAADKAGDVVYVKGAGVIERQNKLQKAVLKSPVQETDNVLTRDRSRMKLLFRDDSILTLGANSKLVVKKYLYSPESKRTESIYELADGRLKAVVGGPGFKVTTPTAFAAARGTVFVMWYDTATNTTKVAVTEGSVDFGNNNPNVSGTQTIGAGQMSSVTGDGPPKPPGPIGGDANGVLSNLSEPGLPDPQGPPSQSLLQLVDELREQGQGAPGTPPIDQQPGSTKTAVHINLVFP